MLRTLLAVSRPRFWHYVLGPYALGVVAAYPHISLEQLPIVLLFGLYFTFPANVLVYGVNDIFDYDTDVRNAKKQGYEQALPPDNRRRVTAAIVLSHVPFAALLALAPPPLLPLFLIGLLGFIALSWAYSAPPLRFKVRPFWDSASNVLYAFPAVAGVALASAAVDWHTLVVPFIGAWCWCMAMHAFSAVPDIAADTAAGMRTIATALGARRTILLCSAWYAAAAIIAGITLHPLVALLGAPYLVAMARAMQNASDADALMRIYRRFPTINLLVGMLLTFALLAW